MALLTVLAYNEEEVIADTIEAMLEARKLSPLIEEILVVNDGSTDRTQDIIDGYRGELASISHKRNCGKSTGFSSTLDYAKALGYQDIQLLDADMVDLRPNQIVALTEKFAHDPSVKMMVSSYSQGNEMCPHHLSGYRILDSGEFVQKTEVGWKLASNKNLPLFKIPGFGLEIALNKAFADEDGIIDINGLSSRERCVAYDATKMLNDLLKTGQILKKYGF